MVRKMHVTRFKLSIKMKIVLQVATQSFGWISMLCTSFPCSSLSFFCVFSDICWACPDETWITLECVCAGGTGQRSTYLSSCSLDSGLSLQALMLHKDWRDVWQIHLPLNGFKSCHKTDKCRTKSWSINKIFLNKINL